MAISNSKKVIFEINSSEPGTFYYKNFDESKWKKLAQGISYNRAVSLKEGPNNITIRGVDLSGNIAELNRSFSIDSKAPKITKTSPKKGFSDGSFTLEFKEENPKELKLHYGNSDTGMRETVVNLNNCTKIKTRNVCNIDVNLNDYNGEQIQYWFELKDIADSIAQSRPVFLDVDAVDPVINNINYTIIIKSVQFKINITEDHFDIVEYLDSTDDNPKWKKLCSKLKDNICIAKKSFTSGEHDLSIQVIDEAGNSVAEGISFVI
ncbi:MAG: hypothetical protein AABY22_35670 [Nanoarchaeota archaeon]